MVSVFALVLAAGGTVAFAAGHQDHAAAEVVSLDVYAQPAIVDMLVGVKTGDGFELRHQRSKDGGATWTPAVRLPIPPKDIHSPHRGADPQVVAFGDRLVALWTKPGTSKWGGGAIGTALSIDGGATWTIGPDPADDSSNDNHSYIDAIADAAGRFHAVWLDGRDGGQGLRAATSKDFGRTWQANQTVDGRTCECCWNRMASHGGQVSVLYRDNDPRDMALAVSEDGGRRWVRRGMAGAFGWKFDGCPHVGGGVAATDGGLHAVAWTGGEGVGLYAVNSQDGGRTWRPPVRLGTESAHRGDIAASGGSLAAAWDDSKGVRSVSAATSTDGGRTWTATAPLSDPRVRATHPLVVGLDGGRFLVVWTESVGDGPSTWRSAVLPRPPRSKSLTRG
jgi:hypothetical protein